MQKKRSRSTNSITYPFFIEIANVTNDKEWINCFKRCANGFLPKGITFNGKIITYKKPGSPGRMYKISENPLEASKQLISLFISLGVVNIMDSTNTPIPTHINAENSIMVTETKVKTWKNIKSKTLKTFLIEQYIVSLEQIYNLDTSQLSGLKHCITIAKTYNILNSNTITLGEDGKIENVKCISFDGNRFNIDTSLAKTPHIRLAKPLDPVYNAYPSKQLFLEDLVQQAYLDMIKKRESNKVTILPTVDEAGVETPKA